MDVSFSRAWVLSLLWVVPALAAWWALLHRRRRAALAAFVVPALQAKMLPPDSGRRSLWQIALVCIGLACMLVAAARPRWGQREEIVYTRGRDLLIALDVSRSMLANDVRPDRLRRAKADIMDLVSELQGDRAGLLAFRHRAILLCPMTTDYAYLRQAIDAVGLDSAPRGETDIGDAIEKALDAFDSEAATHKAIVLISDGEDLSGRALEAADKAAEASIPIFTVGIGDREGSRIPDAEVRGRYVRYKNEDVVTRLNNETLYEIAKRTGGAYVPIGTSGMAGTTLGTIYKSHLRRVAERDLEETLQRRYVERYQLFLLPGLCLVLAACFLSRGRLRTGPVAQARNTQLKDISGSAKPLKNIAVMLLVSLAATLAWSQDAAPDTVVTNETAAAESSVPPGRSGARQAQNLYRLGRYKDAAETYLQAAAGATRDSRETFRFNAAVSYYKAGEYEKAAGILSDLNTLSTRPEPTVGSALGASLARAAIADDPQDAEGLKKKLETMVEAAEAYAGAARAGGDKDAASDLGSLLQQLPELRQEAHIAQLESEYADRQPFQIADSMLEKQRDIRDRMDGVQELDAPERIRTMEKLAREQSDNADLWIPLKGKLLSALSQQAAQDEDVAQQMGQFVQGIELTRDSMKGTANVLRDAQFDGVDAVETDENAVYGFWKMLAPSGPLVGEALRRQTNTIDRTATGMRDVASRVETLNEAGADQVEAKALTDLFLERFQAEYPEGEQQPVDPAATNAPPSLSPEDRQKILDMVGEAQQKQQQAFDLMQAGDLGKSLVEQEASHKLLDRIAALLPKPPPENQQQDQQQDQQDQQSDSQQQQDESEQQQNESQQDQQNAQQPPEPQEQEPQETEAGQTNNVPPEEVMELLEKALQREREHEAEKRERNRQFPMAPHEKDW